MSADMANRIPRIIVAQNNVFSNPRLVWKPELKLSAPKAPPSDAPVRCKRMAIISSTESTICTNGREYWRKAIELHYTPIPDFCKEKLVGVSYIGPSYVILGIIASASYGGHAVFQLFRA